MASSGYELLEHTADVGVHVWAPTFSALLETAVLATFSIEYDPKGTPLDEEVSVMVEAPDREALIADFIQEVIYLHDTSGFVIGKSRVDHASDTSVTAEVCGSRLGPWFEQTGPQLKAVTYHGLSVQQTLRGFEATLYFDV